jgi:D-alanyl-D-alanine carboxypeptidase/D-alanyl-D-alanine-endopeptidase (penicillin-binding protein 4)
MFAAAAAAVVNTTTALEDILVHEELKGAIAAACVMDANGEVLYERSSTLFFNDTATTEIYTCAFVLSRMAPEETIKTRIWKTDDGLIVDAPGDPTLPLEALQEAREKLNVPEGSTIYVRQAFAPGRPPSWEWDDLKYRYAAPIQALSFDRAAFEVWGENGEMEEIPEELGIEIIEEKASRFSADFDLWNEKLILKGKVPRRRTMLARFAQLHPARSAAAALGGKLSNFEGDLPETTPNLVLESETVSKMVKDCLEPSDNVMAEHLLLAAAGTDEPLPRDCYPAAALKMKTFLEEAVGVPSDTTRPIDGSGLSRQNISTAHSFCSVLRWADGQTFKSTMREGLAAPGEGTLKTRLAGIPFVGKTGTINAVCTLSGILAPQDRPPLYVSVIFNGSMVRSSRLRKAQDDFVRTCMEIWYDDEHGNTASAIN